MRTKFWAKVLSMVTIAAMVFTSCGPQEEPEAKGSLTVNPTEVSLNADGKSVTNNKAVSVTVTSTSEYSIVSASEWINAKALNKTRLTIEAEKNNQADARTGEVVLKNAENVEAKITVSQLGFAAALEVSTTTVEVEANGNEEKPVTVTVTSNLDWNATTEAEWVEVEVSENTIVLTVEPSNEFEARTATVNVVPTEASFANLAKTITVNQAAQVYSIEVEAEGVEEGKVTVPSNDAELTFAVTANAAWTISAGDADWVDFGEGEFTATDEEALVIFADNAGTAARTATLTFTCGEATATVEVTQRGAGVFIELVNKVDAISAGSESTSVEVEVKTNATNIQVSTKENANWINGLYDADSKVVTLNIAENTGTPREATVVLTGSLEGAEPSSIEVLVKQNQFAQNLAVNAEGETETANCYAIYKAGCYKFPATVKGNGAGFFDADGYDLDIAYIPGGSTEIDAADIAKATLLWSTKSVVDPQTQVESGLLTDVSVSGGYVYFTMPEPFEVGNAAIAIKDKKGNILWSWHIWATPFDVNAEANTFPVGQTPDSFEEEAGTHTTGYAKPSIFMGLNLGATHSGNNGNCTLDELQASMGYMYNWGRKDPFPGGYPNLEADAGGANMIMYYHDQDIDIPEDLTPAVSTEASMYNITPPHETINDNIDWAIAHPTIYLKSVGTYGDNCIYSNLPTNYSDGCDENNNSSYWWGYLWGNYTANSSSEGSKSLHDPCPPGWQVPCGDHWHIVTSHSDNIGTWYASYAPWKLNVKEASDSWEQYDGFDPESVFWPWAHTDEGKWNNSEMIKFDRGGNWKGGFNVFTGQSNRTDGGDGTCVTAANCPTGAFTPHADGIDEGRNIQPITEAGTIPMFVPAAGWRMGYNPGSQRVGRVARYHCNQPQNITLEGATWTKHQTMSMSMWLDGTFYRNSAVSWAEWMGNGHPVRCIKPVMVIDEE